MKYGLILLALLVGCSTQASDSVKIGAIISLSNTPLAAFGQDIQEGMELFKEEHQRFVVIYEDDQFQPRQSVSAYRKLRDVNKVSLIAGPLGYTALQTTYGSMSEEDKEQSLLVGVSLCVEEFKTYENTLCTYPPLDEQIKQAFRFAQSKNLQKVYLVGQETAYGKEILDHAKEAAKKYNRTVVGERTFTDKEKTFADITLRINQADVDYVYIGANDPEAVFLFIRRMKEQNVDAAIVAGVDANKEYLDKYKDYVQDVYFTGFISDKYVPEFEEKFFARYNKRPNLYSALGYEAISLLAAVAQNGTISKETAIDIENTKDFALPGLVYKDYMAVMPLHTMQVVNGSLIEVS